MKGTKNKIRLLLTLGFVVMATWGLTTDAQAAVENGNVSFESKKIFNSDIVRQRSITNTAEKNYGASVWDQCSNSFYYDRMSAQEKTFYNNLYSVCMNYLTTDVDAVFVSGSYCTLGAAIPRGLSDSQVVNVAKTIMINCPQFYFLNNAVIYDGTNAYMVIYNRFANGVTRNMYTTQFGAAVDNFLSIINGESTIYNKLRKAHDLIISRTDYSYGTFNQSCAGVFLDNNAVCAGYAEAFALLANRIGVPCISITSYNHEWNRVYYNGEWLSVDVTQDEYDGHRYFLVNNTTLRGSNYQVESWLRNYGVSDYSQTTESETGSLVRNGIDYSPVFDPTYYAQVNGDIRAAFGLNTELLLNHFINYGMNEGRVASPYFSCNSYRLQYADLRAAFGNDKRSYYMHYLNYGRQEGRQGTGCTTLCGAVTILDGINYSDVYDYNSYRTYNRDVANAFGEDDVATLRHFVNYGMSEGRRGSASFDWKSYKLQYADLRGAFGNDIKSYYMHYVRYGKNEGRQATGCTTLCGATTVLDGVNYASVYNYNYYINNNRDVANAFGGDDVATLRHFVNYGMAEGRNSSPTFNYRRYKETNRDLQSAYGNDTKSYYMHYIMYGIYERRNAI